MDPDRLPGAAGATADNKLQTQEVPKYRSFPQDQIRQGFEPRRFKRMGVCSWL